MKGPTAPKDPEKRRPFFYIIRDKEVFGAKTPDGRGIQFIYENDGRLINSARIVGNITDEKILELLKTTRGLQKLVCFPDVWEKRYLWRRNAALRGIKRRRNGTKNLFKRRELERG